MDKISRDRGKDKLLAIVQGVGSTINIFPEPMNIEELIITDPTKRMQYTWQRVGSSMWRALDEFQATQETQEK